MPEDEPFEIQPATDSEESDSESESETDDSEDERERKLVQLQEQLRQVQEQMKVGLESVSCSFLSFSFELKFSVMKSPEVSMFSSNSKQLFFLRY